MKGVRISIRRQRLKYVASDWLTGNIAFFLFNIVRYNLLREVAGSSLEAFLLTPKLISEQIIVPFAMLGIYWLSGYYNDPFGKSRLQEFLTTFLSSAVNTLLVFLILLINDNTGERMLNYQLILSFWGMAFIFCYFGRILITGRTLANFRDHHWQMRVLIIGNSEVAHKVAKKLLEEPCRISYDIRGFVEIPGEEGSAGSYSVYGLGDLTELCRREKIDRFIIATKTIEEEKILNLIYHLFPFNLSIRIAPDTYSIITSSVRLKDIHGDAFVDITSPAISESSKNLKRSFDVAVSIGMLILLCPLMAIISFLVRLDSPGRVIFTQERVGLKQKPFTIYKFRTMRDDAEKDGPCLSDVNDPRVTKIGRILRKYRLDELPQFWNVLIGDMSLVGPRPERRYYIDQIRERVPYYALVCQVRPGITSWGMVKYGYASTVSQMVERTKYDLIYLSNMSLTLDLKIMIYTVLTVIEGKGK